MPSITLSLAYLMGDPVSGARVQADLITPDVLDDLVTPKQHRVTGTTDAAGELAMALYGNTASQVTSYYRVRAWHPTTKEKVLDIAACIPATDAALHECSYLAWPPTDDVCPASSAVCPASSAVCPASSAVCPASSAVCLLSGDNSTFSSSIGDWVVFGASSESVNGEMEMTGGAGQQGLNAIAVSTDVGATYEVSADIRIGTGTDGISLKVYDGNLSLLGESQAVTDQTSTAVSIEIVATTEVTLLYFWHGTYESPGLTYYADNVNICEA